MITPTQFRLAAQTLAQIDALKVRLGLRSRAEVVRHALARLADSELYIRPPKKLSGKSKKS